LPLTLERFSRVDIDLEIGGVLNMLESFGLAGVFSGLSSALSEVEPLDDDFSSLSRFDDLSPLDLEDFFSSFFSSLPVPAVQVPQEEPSRLIFARSFFFDDDFGSGGGVGGASGTAGGAGGRSAVFDLLLFFFLDLSFEAMSAAAATSWSSSSSGKLPGISEDFWLFLEDALSSSASSSAFFFAALARFFSSFEDRGGSGAGGGGGGSSSTMGSGSGADSKVLSLSAILPPTAFRDDFMEASVDVLDKGVVSLSMVSSRTIR
jgi:hypothetical protein